MFNAKQLLDSIELRIELEELEELGLTPEEIEGFVDFFYNDQLIPFKNIVIN